MLTAPAFFVSLFLANAAPPSLDAATQNQAFVFLGGLAAAALMANQVMGAVVNWRKMKGADPQDEKRYATRQEHNQLRDEVTGIKADFGAMSRTLTHSFNDLQRSIGRLEGKLDKTTPPQG